MLAEPVLGRERTQQAVADFLALENVPDIRQVLALQSV
jgi:hypothetical protein